ncbi:MAG: DUF2599 domain-containing protein [Cellulomonas sp.]
MSARPPRIGRAARVALALALATMLAGTLGACTAPSEPRPTAGSAAPGSTPTATAPADVGASAALVAAARAAGTPLASGDVILSVATPTQQASVAAQDDGSAVLTFGVGAGPGTESGQVTAASTSTTTDRLVAVLAAPAGLGFDVRTDGSVAVTAGTEAVVGALLPVTVVDGTGSRLPTRLATRADDPTLLEVTVRAERAGTATLTFGANPLVSAIWGDREGGRSLAVVPSPWVRTGSQAAQEALWSALVAAEPEADSTSMHDQLTCHALGAPTKASWNLEPWRPAVDSFTLLAARCNP